MIKLDNVTVIFNKGTADEHVALRNVNLRVEAGDFVTVVGSNGAGKSTLLNLLAGDVACDEGSVLFNNSDVTKLLADRRAHHVSRVFQDPHNGTCAELSIEENLALALRRGQSRSLTPAITKLAREEFTTVLHMLGLGLDKRLRDPLSVLSGGQRQAVSLLMATLRPSQLLLLDEHTAALDPKMAALVLELTSRIIKERQLTAIMITHNMAHALSYGNRTLVMHQGNIIRDLRGDDRSHLSAIDLLNLLS